MRSSSTAFPAHQSSISSVFTGNAGNTASDKPKDMRDILVALQKSKFTAEQIGAIAVVAAMMAKGEANDEDEPKNEEVQADASFEDVPFAQTPSVQSDEEDDDVKEEEIEEEIEENEEEFNIESKRQFPALPKSKSTCAPSPVRAPAAKTTIVVAVEQKTRPIAKQEFSNEPLECWHFYNGPDGCQFGSECRKWHGAFTRKGRRVSARTADEMDSKTIVCFKCGDGHHSDECQCANCGSERHITAKCPRCHNCGVFGHINRNCAEPRRKHDDRQERGQHGERIVYGTPGNWKY